MIPELGDAPETEEGDDDIDDPSDYMENGDDDDDDEENDEDGDEDGDNDGEDSESDSVSTEPEQERGLSKMPLVKMTGFICQIFKLRHNIYKTEFILNILIPGIQNSIMNNYEFMCIFRIQWWIILWRNNFCSCSYGSHMGRTQI